MTLKNCLLAIALLFTTISKGQDIHFSQFLYSPLNLNPATTGDFDGGFRFVGNGRRQWNSVTVPYQTYAFSTDAHDFARLKNVGAGMSLFHDNAGDSRLNTNQLNLSASYNVVLTSTQSIRVGIQSGITQRRINNNKLTFDNQFQDERYNPDINPNESLENLGRTYANINTGLVYNVTPIGKPSLSVGISFFNINKPKQSYFDQNTIRLDRRLNFHVASVIATGKKTDLMPAFLFMKQGTFHEFNIGTSLRYNMTKKDGPYRAVSGGIFSRLADAALVTGGVYIDKLFVGVSYDINYSKLTQASSARGGLEVAVIYIIAPPVKRMKYKYCPDFI